MEKCHLRTEIEKGKSVETQSKKRGFKYSQNTTDNNTTLRKMIKSGEKWRVVSYNATLPYSSEHGG